MLLNCLVHMVNPKKIFHRKATHCGPTISCSCCALNCADTACFFAHRHLVCTGHSFFFYLAGVPRLLSQDNGIFPLFMQSRIFHQLLLQSWKYLRITIPLMSKATRLCYETLQKWINKLKDSKVPNSLFLKASLKRTTYKDQKYASHL